MIAAKICESEGLSLRFTQTKMSVFSDRGRISSPSFHLQIVGMELGNNGVSEVLG